MTQRKISSAMYTPTAATTATATCSNTFSPDHRMVYYASLVSAYKLVDGEGNISTDLESQEVARRMLKALIKYFSDNNLLVAGRGEGFAGGAYYRNDFTDDGIELLRHKEAAWLKSKASKKNLLI